MEADVADILLRNVGDPLVRKLKDRARRHRRSLQAELHVLIQDALQRDEEDAVSYEEAVRFADEMRERFAGRITGDSTDLIREDRDR